MSTKTNNLKLTKPAATDIVDISAINENMDIIDENLATRAEMNTIKKNLDDSDTALRSSYEAADASLSKDLQTTKNNLQTAVARIDNLIVSSGSDSSAEVIDTRIGYDGTTYGTLGKAVRGQVGDLYWRVYDLEQNFIVNPIGKNLLNGGKVKKADGENIYTSDFIKVESGKTYYMSKNGSSFMLVSILVYDKNKKLLSTLNYVTNVSIKQDGYVILKANSDIREDGYQFEANGITGYIKYKSRTTLDKDVEYYVTPEMFGAIGDGATDDSDAIQKAIDYAADNNLIVKFSRASYKITKAINIKNNTVIHGNMATIKNDGWFTSFVGSKGVVVDIRDLQFEGAADMRITDNIAIKGSFFYSNFDNIKITGFYRGIDLSGADVQGSLVENKFTNITVFKCKQGLKLGDNDGNARGTDGFLENVVVWCEDSEYAIQLNTGSGWRVNNVHVYGTVITAIFLVNAFSLDVSNIYIEKFSSAGIFVNNQGFINISNVEAFLDEENSNVFYLEKSGWTVTPNVYTNISNVHVWVKGTGGNFINGKDVHVNLSNYSKSGNTGNIIDNNMNNKNYVKIANYTTL